MAVLVVALAEPATPEFRTQVISLYPPPKSYEFSNTAFFVQDDNIPEVIARKLRIKVEAREENTRLATGAVFGLDGTYAGYTHKSLWDWLSYVGRGE